MAKIASGNVEIYVKQLLSEMLGNDVDTQTPAMDEILIKQKYLNLTHIRLSDKSEG